MIGKYAKAFLVILIFNISYSRSLYAIKCWDSFLSLAGVTYQEVRYKLRILPKGTSKYEATPDQVDHKLQQLAENRYYAGAWELLDAEGTQLAVEFFRGNENIMPTETAGESLMKILDHSLKQNFAERVAIVRQRHFEPHRGVRINSFSPSIRKHALEFKYNLENNGFEHAAFEFQIIFPSLFSGENRKKGFIIPAHLNWRDNDYSPGRNLRLRALSQDQIEAGER